MKINIISYDVSWYKDISNELSVVLLREARERERVEIFSWDYEISSPQRKEKETAILYLFTMTKVGDFLSELMYVIFVV